MKKISKAALVGLIITGALALVLAAVLPLVEKGKHAPATWESYLKNPYSVPVIKKYLQKTGNSSRWVIGDRTISGVYRANHNKKTILYIIEFGLKKTDDFRTYNGTLMAFNAEGKHLKTWDRESIEKSVIEKSVVESDSTDILEKISAGEIIDLPDLNGDTYSDIPTYRFSRIREIAGTLIIYVTRGNDLECVFAVECSRSLPSNNGKDWGELFLKKDDTGKQGLILELLPYMIYKTETVKSTKKNLPSSKRIYAKQDPGRPPETLAEFQWSESQQTFIGPESDSSGLWKMLDAKGRETISKTMIAPKQPGLIRKLQSLVPSSWKKKTPVVGEVRKNEAGSGSLKSTNEIVENGEFTVKQPVNKTIAIGRAGDVRIGMPADSVYITFGRANVRETDLKYEGHHCPALEIYLPGESKNYPSIVTEIGESPIKVWRIQVRDARFRTVKGIGPGSMFGELQKQYSVESVGVYEIGTLAIVKELRMAFEIDSSMLSINHMGSVDPKSIADSTRIINVFVGW